MAACLSSRPDICDTIAFQAAFIVLSALMSSSGSSIVIVVFLHVFRFTGDGAEDASSAIRPGGSQVDDQIEHC